MEIAVKSLSLCLNPKLINHKQTIDVSFPNFSCRREWLSHSSKCSTKGLWGRESKNYCRAVGAALSVEDVGVSSSKVEDVSFSCKTNEARELKIRVEVSGAKTRAIFDEVFDKIVAAAQPIPGFRRVKGGKTPNIPKDILLEVLGPSKVYKQVIKKVINSMVSQYVEKEGLKVSKDLRVDQSYEDLEDMFEPGEDFNFDVIVKLQEKTE